MAARRCRSRTPNGPEASLRSCSAPSSSSSWRPRWFAVTGPSTGATVTVPNLQGVDEKAAQTRANESGLLVVLAAHRRRSGRDGRRPDTEGRVLPRARRHREARRVQGSQASAAPARADESRRRTRRPPEKAQYVVVIERQFNETAPKEAVTVTVPAGKAPPDTTVKLIVSDGPAPVAVPNVARKSYDAAAAQITTAKLVPAEQKRSATLSPPARSSARTRPRARRCRGTPQCRSW